VDSVQELFGEPPPGRAELGPQSRTASKRRGELVARVVRRNSSPLAAEEFRKLGRELAGLPPRTLARMALPIDLAEALEEVRKRRLRPPPFSRPARSTRA